MMRNRVLTPKSRGCYHPMFCARASRRSLRIWLGEDGFEDELDQATASNGDSSFSCLFKATNESSPQA
jgi:hypothetical protein